MKKINMLLVCGLAFGIANAQDFQIYPSQHDVNVTVGSHKSFSYTFANVSANAVHTKIYAIAGGFSEALVQIDNENSECSHVDLLLPYHSCTFNVRVDGLNATYLPIKLLPRFCANDGSKCEYPTADNAVMITVVNGD